MHGYALASISAVAIHALFSADLVILGAQIDLIGAPEPMSIETVLAAPNKADIACSATGQGLRCVNRLVACRSSLLKWCSAG